MLTMGKQRWLTRCYWPEIYSAATKNSGELILDNNDLERERGITILSKKRIHQITTVQKLILLILRDTATSVVK